ncbi:immunomodulatory protein [Desarmillaria tabescens]|uniref:Immunomodulatory protein n=1 Tax=Armillaria tabescens TaxID=1929756 RepID=A0AA39TRT6_ARMTA|nr:immunomodulatory protein [Desarmillaria tabescens]KAK0464368.1 immunomodulatory protein [Desarmillaria tabescens]
MKLFSTLALALIPSSAFAVTIGYDSGYGISTNSLANVACSNGANGLLTKGFTTYGSLPTFPNITSSDSIAGWNSPNCGTCWQLSYNGLTATVIAIDHALSGFYTSQATLDALTGGHAVEFGTVQGTATQVAASACGL